MKGLFRGVRPETNSERMVTIGENPKELLKFQFAGGGVNFLENLGVSVN